MSTPEGKVKARIKEILNEHKPIRIDMPVQNGMGKPTLDFTGCHRGDYFAIEAKAPGKKPTPRQWLTINETLEAGGKVFVIDGTSYEELKTWLERL